MGSYYMVVEGDHISKIAKENGFPDYHTIWDHPKNTDLKKQRDNPNVLNPGDMLFIPDKEQKEESGNTEKRHTFQIKREPLKLRLVLEDMYEKPIANATYALLVEGVVTQKTTDGQGHIEQDIPLDAHEATLVLRGDETPFRDVPFPVKIGDLDPVDERSGQLARLSNLGYFPGDGTDHDAFESAVEEFQCDHHPPLKVDGICGSKTQAQLLRAHGC